MDSIPVVLTILMQMGVQLIVDTLYVPHGNHRGSSVGQLATVFSTYVPTEADHKMCPVRKWANEHRRTLEGSTGQTIRSTDFTDDRLGDVLRHLSDDERESGLFETGRSEKGGFEVQFKEMLSVLEPLGMPLAADVVAGNRPTPRCTCPTTSDCGSLWVGRVCFTSAIARWEHARRGRSSSTMTISI